MKKYPAVIATTGIFGALAAAVAYAPEFMWQFASNLAYPLGIALILVGFISAIIVLDAYKEMEKLNQASSDWEVLNWRIWTCYNLISVMSVLWILAMAIPDAHYHERIVTKKVMVEKPVVKRVIRYTATRVVYHTPNYEQAFNLCVDAGSHDGVMDRPTTAQCHRQAEEASLPPYRTRIVYKQSPEDYSKLFDKCFGGWTIKNVSIKEINEFTAQCQAFAEAGVK